MTFSTTTACVGAPVAVGCSAESPSLPIRSTTSRPRHDLAEHRVVGRQAGVGAGDDEELAAGGAGRLVPVFAIATTPCV